jgi:hypothetical protein
MLSLIVVEIFVASAPSGLPNLLTTTFWHEFAIPIVVCGATSYFDALCRLNKFSNL